MKGTWVTKGRGLTVGGGRAEAKPDSIPVSSFINRLAGQSTVEAECYINNKLYQGLLATLPAYQQLCYDNVTLQPAR